MYILFFLSDTKTKIFHLHIDYYINIESTNDWIPLYILLSSICPSPTLKGIENKLDPTNRKLQMNVKFGNL